MLTIEKILKLALGDHVLGKHLLILYIKTTSATLYVLSAVQWRVSSTVEGIQYRGGMPSVRWRVFSTDMSHYQYGGGTSLVRWRMCSMDLSHHQYSGGCAVQDYLNCSGGSRWLYLSGKNYILQTILP